MTVDDKYSFLNRDNIKHLIQMQVSQKQKSFSAIFFKVLKSTSYSQNFQKNDGPHSWCISKMMDSEKGV